MVHAILVLLLLCLPTVASALNTTYYIDITAGADTNNGTSTATPWKHIRGMPTCTNVCLSTLPGAGDHFIFKGGETWPNANFKWTWAWSGTVSNRIYIGVDATWFTGAAWTRPIFNGGGTAIGNGGNVFLRMNGSYVTLDNFEFTGYRSADGQAFGENTMINPGTSTGFTVDHAYFHGFSSSPVGILQAFAITGNSQTPSLTVQFTVQNSIFSGKDSPEYLADPNCTGACTINGTFIFHGVAYLLGNYCEYAVNCYLGESLKEAAYNYFTEIRYAAQSGAHGNMFESLQELGPVSLIHDNVFVTNRPSLLGSYVTVWVAPDIASTTYAWNNLIADTGPGNVFNVGGGSLGSACCGDFVGVNNTIECGPDSNPTNVCMTVSDTTRIPTSATIKNNHFITSNVNPISGTGGGLTTATNLPKTKAEASAQGYTFTQTPYKFAPTDVTDYTVGTGTNLTADCVVMTTLCSDTLYGLVYNESNHTVSLYGRTALPRPSLLNWDVGAFQFGDVTPPAAPTGIRVH